MPWRALLLFVVVACSAPRNHPGAAGTGGAGGGSGGAGSGGAGGGSGGAGGGSGGAGGGSGGAAVDANVADAQAEVASERPVDLALDLAPIDSAPGMPARPFGIRRPYLAGARLLGPDDGARDRAANALYQAWKRRLVHGCGGVYLPAGSDFGAGVATVSHLHGAAMMIAVIFAGRDPDARAQFDAFHGFARRYPAHGSPVLMAADVLRGTSDGCRTAPEVSAETDGDLNIALALLMADRQWGSSDAVDYGGEARKTLAAIAARAIDPGTRLPRLGDYQPAPGEARRVRSSDLMLGHFAAFARATSDGGWTAIGAAAQSALERIQSTLSPTAGLFPDFADFADAAASAPRLPAGEDGTFGHHAVRVPIWLGADAADAAVTGGARAGALAALLGRPSAFLRGRTGGDPARIVDGYRLDGTPSGTSNDVMFVAAAAVAALLEPEAPAAWRDGLWALASAPRDAGSYAATMQLIAVLIAGGLWWAP